MLIFYSFGLDIFHQLWSCPIKDPCEADKVACSFIFSIFHLLYFSFSYYWIELLWARSARVFCRIISMFTSTLRELVTVLLTRQPVFCKHFVIVWQCCFLKWSIMSQAFKSVCLSTRIYGLYERCLVAIWLIHPDDSSFIPLDHQQWLQLVQFRDLQSQLLLLIHEYISLFADIILPFSLLLQALQLLHDLLLFFDYLAALVEKSCLFAMKLISIEGLLIILLAGVLIWGSVYLGIIFSGCLARSFWFSKLFHLIFKSALIWRFGSLIFISQKKWRVQLIIFQIWIQAFWKWNILLLAWLLWALLCSCGLLSYLHMLIRCRLHIKNWLMSSLSGIFARLSRFIRIVLTFSLLCKYDAFVNTSMRIPLKYSLRLPLFAKGLKLRICFLSFLNWLKERNESRVKLSSLFWGIMLDALILPRKFWVGCWT